MFAEACFALAFKTSDRLICVAVSGVSGVRGRVNITIEKLEVEFEWLYHTFSMIRIKSP